MPTEPNICEKNNVPVAHARRAFGCECAVCRGPAEREVEPTEEEVKKQLRREKLSEEIMEATRTTYNSGPAAGTTPEAAVDDLQEFLEDD